MADSVRRQLRDGFSEGEQPPVVLVHDSLETIGSPLIFKHFVNGLSENISKDRAQAKGIVTVATKHPCEYFCEIPVFRSKGISCPDWFQVLDCYSDPLGWEEFAKGGTEEFTSEPSSACSFSTRDIRDLEALKNSIEQCGLASVGQRTSELFAVLLDSVSSLLRYHSLPAVMNFLNTLRSHDQVSVLLLLVHSDLHEFRVVSALEYFASTVIYVEQFHDVFPDASKHDNLNGGVARVRQKRRNGRVREQIEYFKVDLSNVTFSPLEKNLLPTTSGKITVPKVQFNLQLSVTEREDRANVILPFEHQGNGDEPKIYDGREGAKLSTALPLTEKSIRSNVTPDANVTSSESKSFGEIHYLRDSDDERPDSDEDPDDDLDI